MPSAVNEGDGLIPRRGHRRRKGEKRVKVYDTEELLLLFDCDDVDTLLAKLKAWA